MYIYVLYGILFHIMNTFCTCNNIVSAPPVKLKLKLHVLIQPRGLGPTPHPADYPNSSQD